MMHRRFTGLTVTVLTGALAATLTLIGRSATADRAEDLIPSRDRFGQLRTFTTNGHFDLTNPFFSDLGTNGRVCFTCHRPDQGWTVTPDEIQKRFVDTR